MVITRRCVVCGAGKEVSSSGGWRIQDTGTSGHQSHILCSGDTGTVALPHQPWQELLETETKLGQFDQLGNTES